MRVPLVGEQSGFGTSAENDMSGILARRTAIVTGASQGLGREIARAFVAAGARVVACARDERTLAEPKSTSSRLPRSPRWLQP